MKEIEFILENNGFYSVVLPEFDRVVGKFLPLCNGSFAVIDKDNEMTIQCDMDAIIIELIGLYFYDISSFRFYFEEEWERVIEKKPHRPSYLEALLNWNLQDSHILAESYRALDATTQRWRKAHA